MSRNSHTANRPKGVGARLPRKEDDRLLRGRGEYVGDIRLVGMLEAAFVRSPMAHARLAGIRKPSGAGQRVFTMADLAGVRPIVGNIGLPGFRSVPQHPLAHDAVRHVGEAIALCLAPTRAEAEDLAEQVEVDLEPLPVVADMLEALTPGAPRVHEGWDSNVILESRVGGEFEAVKRRAAIVVRRTFRTARQNMAPLEGRAVLAAYDRRLDQLTVTTATQMPHVVRAGLSECLGIDQGRIRVIAPDVGGSFGYKGLLLPEEVCLAWVAMQLGRPVRWIEDRFEHLTGGANCREHHYDLTVYADERGRLLGIDCDAVVDAGAYSTHPFSAGLESAQLAAILPGPYALEGYQCRSVSAATNKPPIVPYRGVARTGVCFALEIALDMVARQAGREPWEVRLDALVQPAQMPYTNITGKHFDSGDHLECLRRAVAALDVPRWRERQRNRRPGERRIGIGVALFCEQGASGTAVYQGLGLPLVPGHEQCAARLAPDGTLELRTGAHSHGQGLETSLAQVAHEMLGIDPARVRLIHGDTALTPYSTGTWGSRCSVMVGGAVAEVCKIIEQRVRDIAAHLLEAAPEDLVLEHGRIQVAGTDHGLSLQEVAHAWYREPHRLGPEIDPAGLEATTGYKTTRDSGTFSYAAHACAVAVDEELGSVEILDYVIVEDGGTLINPLIVDGQVYGGAAQGIGTALYEEMPFDAQAQPLASTLGDYILPGASEIPAFRLEHMETPSPLSLFGQKGIGEGGAVAPPAVIANAVNDALADLGVEITESPITPRRLLAALAAARANR
jgi:carbon-monoxide dehydrogenase large subunit